MKTFNEYLILAHMTETHKLTDVKSLLTLVEETQDYLNDNSEKYNSTLKAAALLFLLIDANMQSDAA